jgi:hypothetical protein
MVIEFFFYCYRCWVIFDVARKGGNNSETVREW